MCDGLCHGARVGGIGRRALLRGAARAGVGATMTLGLGSVLRAEEPEGPRNLPATPDEAMYILYEGNRRFVEGRVAGPHRKIARLREVVPRQTPFAVFLGCADSRVPIEIVFGQGFGDLFVTRLANNVASPEAIASLEFGTMVLGAKVLYVLGHSSCGAVTAAIRGEAVPGQISTLFQHIRPAIRAAKGNLDDAIRENVRNQATLLAEESPPSSPAWSGRTSSGWSATSSTSIPASSARSRSEDREPIPD